MLRKIIVLLSIFVCCYCLENAEQLPEESRAKKKKGSLRLLAIAAIVVLAKIAVAKVASFFFLVAFFQKVFYLGGVLLNYFLKNQSGPPIGTPQVTYGAPQEYNTVGYSYEPPTENELLQAPELPSISDFSNGVKWLFSKQQ